MREFTFYVVWVLVLGFGFALGEVLGWLAVTFIKAISIRYLRYKYRDQIRAARAEWSDLIKDFQREEKLTALSATGEKKEYMN